MNWIKTAFAAGLLVAAASAQAGAATGARAERDAIAAEWKVATQTATDARKAVQQSEAYKAARAATDPDKVAELKVALEQTDAYKAAVAAKDSKAVNEMTAELTRSPAYKAAAAPKDPKAANAMLDAVKKPDGAAFAARALEAAKKYAGDDRLLLLSWAALNSGDPSTVKAVIAEVQKDHIQSAALDGLLEMAPAFSRLVDAAESEAFLAKVIADSPHALPRAWAMYWRAMNLQRPKDASDEQKAAAAKMLAEAEALAAGTPLAERIAAPRFEAERLQIGMVAPDIEGEDLDGVAFKLSDYRGKVVVLDFWGFW